MALKEASKEAIYLYNMLKTIKSMLNTSSIYLELVPILEDNNRAKCLSYNPEYHKRTKHINIAYHFTREAISNNYIQVLSIRSKDQLADCLTKATITLQTFEKFKWDIGLR